MKIGGVCKCLLRANLLKYVSQYQTVGDFERVHILRNCFQLKFLEFDLSECYTHCKGLEVLFGIF